MTERSRRDLVAVLVLFGATAAPHPTAAGPSPLPTGFGSLNLGMPWRDAREVGAFSELTRATTAWEHHVSDCGYHSARFQNANDVVLVTTQDHVVTTLSRTTAIPPGSDVMQVAGKVIERYGESRQVTLRNALGAITGDPAQARYVLLEYRGAVDATFAVIGEPLWAHRVTLSDLEARLRENRTIRCARRREQ